DGSALPDRPGERVPAVRGVRVSPHGRYGLDPLRRFEMAQIVSVPAEERPLGRKSLLKQVRREGKVPAVLYGKGMEPRSLQIPAKELETAIRRHGHSAILELTINGSERLTALIKELDHHRLTGHVNHLGLQNIQMSDVI